MCIHSAHKIREAIFYSVTDGDINVKEFIKVTFALHFHEENSTKTKENSDETQKKSEAY